MRQLLKENRHLTARSSAHFPVLSSSTLGSAMPSAIPGWWRWRSDYKPRWLVAAMKETGKKLDDFFD
jgi:hypothetical protein